MVEDVQRLQHRQGTIRQNTPEQFGVTILRRVGLRHAGMEVRQIVDGENASCRLQLFGHDPGNLALIHITPTSLGDPLEGFLHIRSMPDIVRRGYGVVLEQMTRRRRKTTNDVLVVGNRRGRLRTVGKPVGEQIETRLHELCPGQTAPALPQRADSGHLSRHAHGLRAKDIRVILHRAVVLTLVETTFRPLRENLVQMFVRCCRRARVGVDGPHLATSAITHDSRHHVAADACLVGIEHGHRHARRRRCIESIATLGENPRPSACCRFRLGRDGTDVTVDLCSFDHASFLP